MTDRLSPQYVGADCEKISFATLEKIIDPEHEAIRFPEPSLENLTEYQMSPADLREAGHDLPEDDEDPDEALAIAITRFKESDQYYEWQGGYVPVSASIWPCDPFTDVEKLVQTLSEQYVSCVFVDVELDGKEYKGFMLNAGGMNLSDDLAIAYIEAGCIPPVTLLDQAFRNTRKDEWKDKFADAMAQAARWYASEASRMGELLARHHEPEAPSLTI